MKDFNKTKLTDSAFEKLIHYTSLLAKEEKLPPEALDHALKSEYENTREFHIGGDMLVIYMLEPETLKLIRLGTHAKLFN